MPDRPIDQLEQVIDALGAVSDLLASTTYDNLHMVRPGELSSLLDLVRHRAREASDGLSACRG